MNRYFDLHFNSNIVTIYPGEFYSSKGEELISTILGSCISITLYDPKSRIGGMNHFMLARNNKVGVETGNTLMGRFGEYAMQLLIDDLVSKGANPKNFEAKVFGGSNIFNMPEKTGAQVGAVNIDFAFDYLNNHSIKIINSDTGGIKPRKIFFDPVTSKVFLKYVESNVKDRNALLSKEETYLRNIVELEKKAEQYFHFTGGKHNS